MSAQPPTLSRLLGTWALDPVLLCVLGMTAGLYVWGMCRASSPWPIWRAVSFLAGLVVLALALMSGVDQYADELLSVHVIEHLLLILLAPMLLLWGAPVRLALSASTPAARRVLVSGSA